MSIDASYVHPLRNVLEAERLGAAVPSSFTTQFWLNRSHLALVSPPDERATGMGTLNLLGEFQLTVDGVPLAPGPIVQRLLVVLACLGCQAPRNKVAQILWPDTSNKRAQATLRTTISRMQGQTAGLVHSTTTHVRLSPTLRVDFETIRSVALTLLDVDPAAAAEVLRLAPWSELGKDLLPDWDEEWLADYQFSHRKLRLDALEQLARLFVHKGRHGVAVQSALVVIQAEPLRESARGVDPGLPGAGQPRRPSRTTPATARCCGTSSALSRPGSWARSCGTRKADHETTEDRTGPGVT